MITMEKAFLKGLKGIKGIEVSNAVEDRIVNSFDATDKKYLPDFVVDVFEEQGAIDVLKLCNKYNVPIVPRGAGCGFSGGALNVQGGVALNLSYLNSIEIDCENLVAKVGCGAITVNIDSAAKKCGLFYPPDPSSLKISTIGGNIAENAGGPRAVKYGVTGDYVLALKVLLPNGEVETFGKPLKKDVAGYNMAPLFIGSEGTLGIILEAWLRLLPRPEGSLSGMFFFSSTINAGKAIASIVASGKTPSKLEIMDKYCLKALKNAGHFIEGGSEAVLLIEVDGKKEHLKAELEDIKNAVENCGLTDYKLASSESENEDIWSLRRSLSPIINSFGNTKMNEDVVVKRSDIPNLFKIVDELIEEFKLDIVCFGHAGDGNIHVNFMFDRENENTVKNVEKALDILFTKIISLGGSISGEHGIGIAKLKFMKYQFSKHQLDLMRQFKQVFDPNNILNPGKIVPKS